MSAISSALEDDSRDEADLEGSADRCEVPPCPRRRNAPQCLELVAQSFDVPLELSPVVEPSPALAIDMMDGRLEGMVLKDRRSTYRDGVGVGSWSVKDPRWFERESWRFEGRV